MRAGRVALMLFAASLAACKVGPNFKPPQEPVPDQYAGVKALPPTKSFNHARSITAASSTVKVAR